MWAKAAASLVLALVVVVLLGLFGAFVARAQGIPGLTPFLANTIPTLVGTFNPSDKDSNVTLSNGNLTMTSAFYGAVRSTNSISAGLDYVEFTISGGPSIFVGVGTSAANISGNPGSDAEGVGYQGTSGQIYANGTVSATGSTYSAGDVIGMKVDRTNGTVAFNKNGGSFTTTTALPSGDVFIMVGSASGYGCTINRSPLYPVPPGSNYWGN